MIKKVVSFLGNTKLGIIYLITLALLSVLGSTYIKQGETYITYYKEYGEFFAKLIWLTYMNNIFHAWYYQLIMVLLAVSVVFATIDRFPAIYRTAYGSFEKKMPEGLTKKPSTLKLTVNHQTEQLINRLVSFLEYLGFRKVEVIKENNGIVYLFSEKGKYSRLGMLITHAGIIIFLAGALIGSILGVRGQIEVFEGEKVGHIKKYREGSLVPGDEIYKLPFEMKVNRFWLDFYDSKEFAGAVKSYNSEVEIIKDGYVVKKGVVQVNNPMDYEGYRIFQTSYGKTGEMKEVSIIVVDYKKLLDMIQQSQLLNHQLQQLKDTPQAAEIEKKIRDIQRESIEFFNNAKRFNFRYTDKVIQFEGITLYPINQTLNYKNPELVQQDVYDPLVVFKVEYNGKSFNMPVSADPNVGIVAYERFVKPYGLGYVMFIEKFEPRYFSGLQVSYFPGTEFIWLGTVIVVLGTMVAFYTVHRRIWVKIVDDGEQRYVYVSGYSQKFKESFEAKIRENINYYLW